MKIETGYVPGLIGEVVTHHARTYSRISGFDAAFESVVAAGLAEFIPRLDKPENQIWFIRDGESITASITIDGEDLGNNAAHLRWFIVDEALRGSGAGKALLQKAIEFCVELEFSNCILWTFSGLDAARHLYEKHGFILVEEYEGNQWGKVVREQKFIKQLDA